MTEKKRLRRIHVQCGADDWMGRPTPGIFEIFIDEEMMVEQLEQAFKNGGRKAKAGALLAVFHPSSQAAAEFLVEKSAQVPVDHSPYRRKG